MLNQIFRELQKRFPNLGWDFWYKYPNRCVGFITPPFLSRKTSDEEGMRLIVEVAPFSSQMEIWVEGSGNRAHTIDGAMDLVKAGWEQFKQSHYCEPIPLRIVRSMAYGDVVVETTAIPSTGLLCGYRGVVPKLSGENHTSQILRSTGTVRCYEKGKFLCGVFNP